MKKILLACSLFLIGTGAYAQGCSKTLPLFHFDNGATPKPVYKLGSSPQFTFLQHLNTPEQFVAAVMKSQNDPKYKKGINELNSLLMEVGFENGIKDLKQSSVTRETIASGETGKMGNGKYTYVYSQFAGGNDFKAWKLTSDKGCYMYVMAACGNAFYPESAAKEAQPVAMLDVKPYEGNIPEPAKESEVQYAKPVKEDCYCKFRSMYKSYYPYHSRRENRVRRNYGPGDYPRACSIDGTGYCRK